MSFYLSKDLTPELIEECADLIHGVKCYQQELPQIPNTVLTQMIFPHFIHYLKLCKSTE